jgi:hypothetical protein
VAAGGGGASGAAGDGSTAAGAGGGSTADGGGGGDTNPVEPFAGMELILLFGQSNMAGSAPIESQDNAEDPRIHVLGMYDCPGIGRTYNEWTVARPPLHSCGGGLGPADYFAKGLAEAWPNAEIGLIPNAVPGVEIDFFRKGMISNQNEAYKELPNNYESAYDMMVDRGRLAQESGRIRAILFHQGESDSGNTAWVGKVAEIVADLRTDLQLGEDVPFIAGELPPTGCCGGHNTQVQRLPDEIPNTAIVSAQGLTIFDEYHFDSESVRTFGQRYTDAFLEIEPTQ